MEAAIYRWMDKEDVVGVYHGILFSQNKSYHFGQMFI